jgi:protein crumbs
MSVHVLSVSWNCRQCVVRTETATYVMCDQSHTYTANVRTVSDLTAATFGHENKSDSLVTVMAYDGARRSIRNVVDISMFIRTRQEDGTIFYLGSSSAINPGEETFILAQLEAGELLVKIQFNGTEKYTVGGQKLDDGNRHLIQVCSH